MSKITKFLLSGSLILGLSGGVFGFPGNYAQTEYSLLQKLASGDLKKISEEIFDCFCNSEVIQLRKQAKIYDVKDNLSERDKKIKSFLIGEKEKEEKIEVVQNQAGRRLEQILSQCKSKYGSIIKAIEIKDCRIEEGQKEPTGSTTISFTDNTTIEFFKTRLAFLKNEFINSLKRKIDNDTFITVFYDKSNPIGVDIMKNSKSMSYHFLNIQKIRNKIENKIEEFKRRPSPYLGSPLLMQEAFLWHERHLKIAKIYEKHIEGFKIPSLWIDIELSDLLKKDIFEKIKSKKFDLEIPQNFVIFEVPGLIDEYLYWKIKQNTSKTSDPKTFEETIMYQETIKLLTGNYDNFINYVLSYLKKPLRKEDYFITGYSTRRSMLTHLLNIDMLDVAFIIERDLATSCDCFKINKGGVVINQLHQIACAKVNSEMIMPVLRSNFGPDVSFDCENGVAILPKVIENVKYVFQTVDWQINKVDITLPNRVIFSMIFPIPGEYIGDIQLHASSPDGSYIKFLLQVGPSVNGYEVQKVKVVDAKINYLSLQEMESIIKKKTLTDNRLNTQKIQNFTFNTLIDILNIYFGYNERLGLDFITLTSNLLSGNNSHFLAFVRNHTF